MVMSPYVKTILRSIKMTLPRFLAIFAIIALGVGFFAGLKVTTPSFVYTVDGYANDYSMFDFRLLSTIGFKPEDIDALSKRTGCIVEGAYSVDCSAYLGGDDSSDTVRFLSITNNVNKLKLESGRMPEKPDEIVIDGYQVSSARIGQKLVISNETSEDSRDMLKYKEFTVVGTVRTPLYLNFQRGTSDEGSGSINYFVCALPGAFDSEYFTEAYLYAASGHYIFSDAYKDWASGAEDGYGDVLEDVVNERFDKLLKEEYKKITDEVEDHMDEIDDGWKEINDARKELDDAKKELEDGEKEIKDNRKKLADAKKTLDSSRKKLEDAKKQIESGEKQLKDGKKKLDKAKKELDAFKKQLNEMKSLIAALEQMVDAGMDKAQELAMLKAQYGIYSQKYDEGYKSYKDGKAEYDKNVKKFKTAKAQYNSGVKKYNKGVKQYNDGVKKLDDAQKKLDDGWKEYNDGLREFWDGYYDFAQGVNEMYMGVVEGRTLIESAELPDTYILGRDKNTGYVCFDNDAKIVDGVAAVFPIFFFAIAALVCSTTMSRMVNDERGIIGTMRALGYTDTAIVMKYAVYAGSAAVLGTVLGFLGGTKLFPFVIWEVYKMMYGFTDLSFTTSIPLFILTLGVALLCTVGVSVVTAMSALTGMPAELIRPKAPLPGKRILLERIGFIWKRMRFLHKVSARNVFRFKKRMWMMIVGIAGCTALLITAFGLYDSVCNVVNIQFDTIMKYDLKVTFDDSFKQQMIEDAVKDAHGKMDFAFDYVLVKNDTAKNNGSNYLRDVELFISDDPNTDKIFGLNDVKTGEKLSWPSDGEVAVSGKLADKNHVKAGDYITLTYGDDDHEVSLKVSSVFTNYTFHYILMTPGTYREAFGKTYNPDTVLAATENKTAAESYKIASYLSDNYETKTWSSTADSRESFSKTMERMNYVIVLVIASAAALAFIVLFNLNNINITERIREIATLKVMGFNRTETGAYVTRENVILVLLGFLAGIPLGFLLHRYVMAQIAMDMITYQIRIVFLSYVYSLAFVLAFSTIVNLIMRAKIEKIDMAESLKSAE
ncbi:MAG: FtsX-like permease family protein [Saccharofermentans sp.]|nr:FtsX-like permease family protein [Saccharofermentans sp.]